MSEYVKVIHDLFPDTEIVELSEYKEEKNDYYNHWKVLREATDNEIPRKASPGPNVQYEENNESSELSTMKNENDDVIVELSKSQENNGNNGKGIIEVSDPYSERAEKFFDEEELAAIRSAHEEDNPEPEEDYDEMMKNISSEMRELKRQKRKEEQRKKTREKVENWDPRYGKKVEEMTAEQFSDLMAKAQEGKTLEEELEQEVDSLLEEESENEEELSPDPDPETAKEAVEAWGDRNDVFAEFAATIEEENDIQGSEIEELEEEVEIEDIEELEDTTVRRKHDGRYVEINTREDQLISELTDIRSQEGVTILSETPGRINAEIDTNEVNL